MTYEHIYLEYKGIKYYDYTLYTDAIVRHKMPTNLCFGINAEVEARLKCLQGLVMQMRVPINSTLYVSPNCPRALDDIRKNYTIKRVIDSGDYNVISPIKETFTRAYVWTNSVMILPAMKAIVATYDSHKEKDMHNVCATYLSNIDWTDAVFKPNGDTFSFTDKLLYRQLLDGTIVKPCVTVDSLTFNTGHEVSFDALELVYRTGQVQRWEPNAKQNYLLQLHALNQHNWMEYQGTISLVLTMAAEQGRSIAYEVFKKRSSAPKAISALLNCSNKRFMSEKDFNMGQAFLAKLLNIDGVKYTTVTELKKKLQSIAINERTFSVLFDNMVRITPKKYEKGA